MSSRAVLYHFILLLALLLTACHNGQQMRQALSDLQARNQADSLLTDDSLALALTRYFDRHGTPNERMEAHYLLGRTNADRGEAPQAIAAYQTAAEQADTTATDCDYRLLCRVYSQMGYLLYQQNLVEDYLECLDDAIAYADKAADTIVTLNLMAQKMSGFERLNLPDSVISVYEKVYAQFCSYGYSNLAASFSAYPIMSYLKKGMYREARQCIDIYQNTSGYFDDKMNVSKGREIFYYFKGQYYLSLGKYDSAEYYFRKELTYGRDFNNQNAASKGLATLYRQTARPDSSAKYALYSYNMNDSAYMQMATEEIVNARGLYNYTNHQRQAIRERQRAEYERRKANAYLAGIAILLIGVCTGSIVAFRWYKRREKEREIYRQKIEELERSQADTDWLRLHAKDFESLVIEKERGASDTQDAVELERLKEQSENLKAAIQRKEMTEEKLRQEIAHYRKKESDIIEKNNMLHSDPVCAMLYTKAGKGEKATEDDWRKTQKLTADKLPEFHRFMTSRKHLITGQEYRTCVFLRLGISNQGVANLLGVSNPYVSQLSKSINKKLFNDTGATKALVEKLMIF